MRNLVVRSRNSGYTTTICTVDEDNRYWYVNEICDNGVETLRYPKSSWEVII